jgi:hypothetical protein
MDSDLLIDKILNDPEPFYYLMYHNVNAQKMITITNSITGEMIYCDHTIQSVNIKSKDLKKLSKDISKL